jgi:2-hydroxychromene-2-carboxylate isomerase
MMTSDLLKRFVRYRGAMRRRLSGNEPTVHYFHQPDDPYSHLAVQKLDALKAQYKVNFENHLVSSPRPEYQGDVDRFYAWGLNDARSVAEFYGAELPDTVSEIDTIEIESAQGLLAEQLDSAEFATSATRIGNQLWRGEKLDPATANGSQSVDAGNKLRQELGHYLGAMFYFEGEWYWGVDRLYHLENRLRAMNLSMDDEVICVPRPIAESATGINAADVTLEYFPSLRSPYTAISYARTIDLARRSGVTLVLKPVMPMMMRGIPAPFAKQRYIITDTAREADAVDVSFGRAVDPFGEPVKRAFSLLPFMDTQGKAVEYCAAYLKAAFADGIDITTEAGLEEVVESIGLDWQTAKPHLDAPGWEQQLEANVSDMLEAGLWGVPSFRVTGGNATDAFCCWGQDRLWRVETEICRRTAS